MNFLQAISHRLKPGLAGHIAYKHFNERDIEIPALLDFMQRRRGKFFSLLDVGAHYSHAHYAPLVKEHFPGIVYDGVDICPDPETASYLNKYHVGSITEVFLGPYDLVTCISTIEHCGLTSYKCEDYLAEQLKIFARVSALAKKYVFASFPFGRKGLIPGQYANITPEQLDRFIEISGGKAKTSFYYNEFPQGRKKWKEVSQAEASTVPLKPDRGVQCVCILEIEKPISPFSGEFHGITKYLLKKTKLLGPQPEYTPGREDYTMFNTGGVELEVGEFLYAFVKMTKPERILETGTHLGISAMYMAQALKENKNNGQLVTLEIFSENIQRSKKLWKETSVSNFISVHQASSLQFETKEEFDLLFLDSEPDIRFDELVRFYDHLKPGGFILIHDLHVNLGLSDLFINGMQNWPFGDFREKFGYLIKDFSLQTFSFRTPRGLVIFQKADKDFSHTNFLRQDVLPISRNG